MSSLECSFERLKQMKKKNDDNSCEKIIPLMNGKQTEQRQRKHGEKESECKRGRKTIRRITDAIKQIKLKLFALLPSHLPFHSVWLKLWIFCRVIYICHLCLCIVWNNCVCLIHIAHSHHTASMWNACRFVDIISKNLYSSNAIRCERTMPLWRTIFGHTQTTCIF